MNRQSLSRECRVYLLLVLGALVASCVYIDAVAGPAVVAPETVAEFVVDLDKMEFEEFDRGTDLVPHLDHRGALRLVWTFYLAVDVPDGWTFHSCGYEGAIGGLPVAGVGHLFMPTSPTPCEPGWPPVPDGSKRLWIQSETHDTNEIAGGLVTARVRFNVDCSPGVYTLVFLPEPNQTPGSGWCTDPYYFTVEVSDSIIFTDGFESGDTSAWSETVP